MTEKGMVFTGDSILAILEGRKTVTRRVIKFPKPFDRADAWPYCRQLPDGTWMWADCPIEDDTFPPEYMSGGGVKPLYQVGDLVYAKETLWKRPYRDSRYACYRIDDHVVFQEGEPVSWPWKAPSQVLTSRFMPKKYARIWREITGVRPERLQEITEEDAIAEGCQEVLVSDEKIGYYWKSARLVFSQLWDSLHGKGAWDSNPWVWRYEFKEANHG